MKFVDPETVTDGHCYCLSMRYLKIEQMLSCVFTDLRIGLSETTDQVRHIWTYSNSLEDWHIYI